MRSRLRILISENHPGLVDFYRDYVAHGDLFDSGGQLVSDAVEQKLLNRLKADPRAEFRHPPSSTDSPGPVNYGRMDQAEITDPSGQEDAKERFLFRTYHAVFRQSGLPRALRGWKAALLGLLGDLRDWHQLDHYTAVTVVRDAKKVPVPIMIQRHNYLRPYFVGEGIELPPDERVVIDVAIRSNELYPHLSGRHRRRAVRFAGDDDMAYLMGFIPPAVRRCRRRHRQRQRGGLHARISSPGGRFLHVPEISRRAQALAGSKRSPGSKLQYAPRVEAAGSTAFERLLAGRQCRRLAALEEREVGR